MLLRLSEIEPSVDHDSLARDTRRTCPLGAIGQKLTDGKYDIVVLRVRIRNTRRQSNMGGDDRSTSRSAHVQLVGVSKTADVVSDTGAGFETRFRYRCSPGVDR